MSLGGLIMATAIALDPVSELEQMVDSRNGVEPHITVADDTALVSFQLAGGVYTELWLHGERGWQLRGTHGIAG
ncbi:MAG: hypothetical protein QOI17_66 [Gaiellales bacterium]|jgi:hypothetical protein|nr:hypothetical protein [Gaiellales bacterium]